jgi:hypothetical protein
MKKLFALQLAAIYTVCLLGTANMAFAETASPAPNKTGTKKATPEKKEVKKHQKFEGTKVEGTKPDTVAPKKK